MFFDTIKKDAVKNKIEANISSGLYAFLYFILLAVTSLPDYYFFISFLSVLILVPINNLLFEINKSVSSTHETKLKFTIWNWMLTTIFLFWLLFFPLLEKYTGLSSNSSLRKIANKLNKDLPKMLDDITRLDKVTSDNNILTYQYSIVHYDTKYMNENTLNNIKKSVIKSSCEGSNNDIYLKNGVIFKYVYLGNLEKELITVVVTKDNCRKINEK